MTDRNPLQAQHRGPVLVTGAFGLVGSTLVRTLADAGYDVVATDLDLPANRKSAAEITAPNVTVLWADLTQVDEAAALVRSGSPAAIAHLAAIIPPFCYRKPELARAVNVDATASLLHAAQALPVRPRFVLASSVAVYGARNPYHIGDLLSPVTPLRPVDLYGAHKVEAEQRVRVSGLDWVILRLGGVLTVEPQFAMDRDMMYFEAALPTDGRIQTVDVRDVAAAFAAAITTPATREVFLIGGDDSHRLRQGDIAARLAGAMGLVGGIPAGRPGDPDRDRQWFTTDWMDTTRSQAVLAFQRHSLPDMLAEIRSKAGQIRYPLLRMAAPLARRYLKRQSPYRHCPNAVADPWTAVRVRFGPPEPDTDGIA